MNTTENRRYQQNQLITNADGNLREGHAVNEKKDLEVEIANGRTDTYCGSTYAKYDQEGAVENQFNDGCEYELSSSGALVVYAYRSFVTEVKPIEERVIAVYGAGQWVRVSGPVRSVKQKPESRSAD